jgi:hypothetical protein
MPREVPGTSQADGFAKEVNSHPITGAAALHLEMGQRGSGYVFAGTFTGAHQRDDDVCRSGSLSSQVVVATLESVVVAR